MTRRWVVWSGFLFAWLMYGCGGGLGQLLPSNGVNPNDPIVGTWLTTSISTTNGSAMCPGSISEPAGAIMCEAERRTYYADGTWTTASPSDLAGTGSYSVASGILGVNRSGTNTVGTISFSADLNTFTWVVGSVTYTEKRQ